MAVEYVGTNSTDGTSMGSSTTEKVSFYGVTPIVQRSGAVQATALITDATAAQITLIRDALIEAMATLTALGLWKGGA